MCEEKIDLLILGAGSAGFGAAYQALKKGVRSVVLVDQNPGPGGTSVFAGVNNWEPGVAGNGIHRELAQRLIDSGDGIVGETVLFVNSERRYAVSDRSKDGYESTLKRAGLKDTQYRRFHFEPDAMSNMMRTLLHESDNQQALLELYNTTFVSVDVENRKIIHCTVKTPEGNRTFVPSFIIDCSAEIVLARAAGCDYSIGDDAKSTYGESLAPEQAKGRLNGITQCFRVMEKKDSENNNELSIPVEYKDIHLEDWDETMKIKDGPVSCFSVYPRGGINVNMLPTMVGDELLTRPYPEIERVCRARAYRYWSWLQKRCHLENWYLSELFPMLGVRESVRLHGAYVLTHEDLQHGYAKKLGTSHTIAYADHPADIHGSGGCLIPPNGTYGIPFECIVPNEIDNLLVACRGSSFTHLAASSARLSRTMMALGEAAGNAAAYCLENQIAPMSVPEEVIATFVPNETKRGGAL